MKKLENPKWEECRNYLRNKVLPRLQETQRDLFGNEKLVLEISVGRKGEYISVYASASDKNGKDTIYSNLSCVDSRKQIDSELSKLTDLIRKHTA
nr:MAG TPA: hypothetical protein [Caudoviricetes sp.]